MVSIMTQMFIYWQPVGYIDLQSFLDLANAKFSPTPLCKFRLSQLPTTPYCLKYQADFTHFYNQIF